jgi:hypothetical protein
MAARQDLTPEVRLLGHGELMRKPNDRLVAEALLFVFVVVWMIALSIFIAQYTDRGICHEGTRFERELYFCE